MLAVLAAQWSLLLFRGVLAVLFGTVALLWPDLTLNALALFFAGYVFIDGVVGLIMAFGAKDIAGFGSLTIQALVGIGAGVITFLNPGVSAVALLAIIAAWAVLSGIAAIAAALALRRELSGEWPLPVEGTLSIVLGVLLMIRPHMGVPGLKWMIGLYAILAGMTFVAFAIRLRQLAHEIAGT